MAGRECYHCNQWIEDGEEHDCWTTTEAALTQELSPDLRDAWERLRETAVNFGEQRIYASHKSIMFSRKSCYFFVRPKRRFLEVCVFLGRTLKAPQVRRIDRASRSKVVHVIHIVHRDEVEAPITDWLQEAYELSGVLALKIGKVRAKPKHKPEASRILLNDSGAQSMEEVDFGTYHHSTPEESKEIRECAEKAFSKLLRPLYPSGASLRILDAGCGLGFLMYVVAKRFPKAVITGVDLFSHESVTELSLDKAGKNMKSLGIESRASFCRHDLTKPLKSDVQYDLAVSNLVFHDMGKKRFRAYEKVLIALKPKGYFVIGDLFPHDKADMDFFSEHATLVSELAQGGSGRWEYKIMVLRKR